MISRHSFTLPLACLPLAACGPRPPATPLAQPVPIEAEESYVHEASGMAFPLEVAMFRRDGVTRYDAQGLDVGAAYAARTEAGAVAASVFVYPAPSVASLGSPAGVAEGARAALCGQQFEGARADVARSLPDARLVVEEEVAAPHGEPLAFGRMAVFETVAAGQRPGLRATLRLYCPWASPWAVKYRVTGPDAALAAAPAEAFMTALPWPKAPPAR